MDIYLNTSILTQEQTKIAKPFFDEPHSIILHRTISSQDYKSFIYALNSKLNTCLFKQQVKNKLNTYILKQRHKSVRHKN